MNYDATKDAINMLENMTEEEFQEWNKRELAKQNAAKIARNRPEGEPSYENGFQEWDD
jgi:hypothetical protein